MESQKKMHVSICKGDKLQPYYNDGKYRCPLCPYSAEESYKVENHITNTALVQYKEFCIFKCSLPCRGSSHFHCPYCISTIIRRDRFVSHLVNHTKSVRSLSSCALAQLPLQPAATTTQAASAAQLLLQPAATTTQAASAAQLLLQPAATTTQAASAAQLLLQPASQLSFQPAATTTQAATAAQLSFQPAAKLPLQPAATKNQAATARLVQCKKTHSRSNDIITCEICSLRLKKRNLRIHLRRKHQDNMEQISQNHHLRSQCVDAKKGVFAVEKSFIVPETPIHVIKNTWSQLHRSECELDRCNENAHVARRSGILPFECEHIKSLHFCPSVTDLGEHLSESTLDVLVENLWFSQQQKEELLKKQMEAFDNDSPLSVVLGVSGTETTFHVSVFEPTATYFSRFGRVIVTYDTNKNTWECPCIEEKRSCMHKATARWHLFEKMPDVFKTAESPEEDVWFSAAFSECQEEIASIPDPAVERTIKYLISHKKIPADLPETLITTSKEAKALNLFPKHLVPSETACTECGQHAILSNPQLISSSAKIMTLTGIVTGVSTYIKTCPNCDMVYRYQDWQDGVHNFDDRLLLSLHFCLVLRNALQTHTAVSRVMDIIERTEGESFPSKDRILQAYMSFEGLTDHDYLYACASCGDHPAVVVLNRHKKGLFSMPVGKIPNPPQNYNGEVNADSFWEAVTMEVISRGFYPSGCRNPFVVKPTYHNWASWIGPQTRRSDIVLNTESQKVCMPDGSSGGDQFFTEEWLEDEIHNLKLSEMERLCEQCGIDGKGSKLNILLRLRAEMASRDTYNKVFQKIWSASGGWSVITCPCGVIYSVKFNLRAQSPRDFADLLLSWKSFPNITVYDSPEGLVSHINQRCPEDKPFHIHEGRLLDHTAENIRYAAERKLQVNLSWLNHKKEPEDIGGHPITGSSEHYCLSEDVDPDDSEDDRDVLRWTEIVPELARRLNSESIEQLFAEMRKNNYFLNTLPPSAHVFLQRNILHHYNVRKNTKENQDL